jgi:hypothetical protein
MCISDCHEKNNCTADCHIQESKFESKLPRGYRLFLLWQTATGIHLRAVCHGVIPGAANLGIGARYVTEE